MFTELIEERQKKLAKIDRLGKQLFAITLILSFVSIVTSISRPNLSLSVSASNCALIALNFKNSCRKIKVKEELEEIQQVKKSNKI